MRDYIDAAAYKEMILCAEAALHTNIKVLNDLNVFPVPDGDTGTNMCLTMQNAANELKKRVLIRFLQQLTALRLPFSEGPAAIPALSSLCFSEECPNASKGWIRPVLLNLPMR